MQRVNWGIIGCGDVTEVKSGPAFNKVPNSFLQAVTRRDAEKARDYASRHGVPTWYNDAGKLINDPAVNAIYIATPPLQHEEYAIMAMEAGKPVYVEKPVSLNAASTLRMQQASAHYGVKLSVAHYRREQPMFLKIKELLAQNVIGDIRFVQSRMLQPQDSAIIASSESNWRLDAKVSGGGLFHDLAPHLLDLMIYFFGQPQKISGIALNQSGRNKIDDLVCGNILFESGVVFNGLWCFTVPEEEKQDLCEIIGAAGKISFPVHGNKVTLHTNGREQDFVFSPLAHVQQPMIRKVVAYFLGGTENPCSIEQAILSMEVMDCFTS